MISNKAGLQYIAELFIREGIKHIVISPGSRNAPMMLTFPEYEELTCYSIVDERSAGFFALGIAQKTRQPVVLNCTSGSALLNYAPAIAEAYYQQLPLIILSADRPNKLIDQGDGQAIRQNGVYHNYIRKSVHLPESPTSEEDIQGYQKLILEAIDSSQSPVFGPVHINVPLDEPIYDVHEKQKIHLLDKRNNNKTPALSKNQRVKLLDVWNNQSKKLIIIGQHISDEAFNKQLSQLAEREDVVMMTESTSNQHNHHFITHIDQVLTQIKPDNEDDFKPELLIVLGGHIVSKKLKLWLRKNFRYAHWHISLNQKPQDTFFHLTEHIQLQDQDFVQFLLEETKREIPSNYRKKWSEIQQKSWNYHTEYVKDIPYSDLKVFEKIRAVLPSKKLNLHFANSTAVRYSQFFHYGSHIHIDSNRGVSGIDGSISTALGASIINQEPTCVITGDLSFFYDSNALWNKYLHPNFLIILINNGGGGIFRFIDGPMQSNHLDFFETTHHRTAKALASDANMEYLSCSAEANLTPTLQILFQESTKSKILEIFTPRELNDLVLKRYFFFLRDAHK
jgi:2-succinyl-5-enolpyruvyl-6-hydroxy-3-cyclohexene-1-carboxylate synthase